MRYYYLCPYWFEYRGKSEFRAPPNGCLGSLNVSPSACFTQGFFAIDRKLTENDLVPFGDGADLREYHTTKVERDAWRGALRLSTEQLPDSVSLLSDILVKTFIECGDPDGAERFKPPTATTAGNVELYLRGHGFLARTPFWTLPFDAQARIMRVVQNDYRQRRELCLMSPHEGALAGVLVLPQPDHYLRYLGSLVRKYRVPGSKLVPNDLPFEGHLPPHTSYGDKFTRPNESLDAGNWTEDASNWEVVNEQVNLITGDVNRVGSARYESDLSSDSHTAIVTSEGGEIYLGVAARYNSGERTYYSGYWNWAFGWDAIGMMSAGSYGELATDVQARTLPVRVSLRVDGSTLTLYVDGNPTLIHSDSSITGNFRGGLHGSANKMTPQGDDFVITDSELPGSKLPLMGAGPS